MPRARLVGAPRGGTKQLSAHSSVTMLSGSIGSAPQVDPDGPLDDSKFETSLDDAAYAATIRQREAAEGIAATHALPEPLKPTIYLQPGDLTYVDDVSAYAKTKPIHPAADLSTLPERFTLEVERKPNGWWKVTAPGVHVGLFVAHQSLPVALSEAPVALAEIVRLDGVVAKPKRGRKA